MVNIHKETKYPERIIPEGTRSGPLASHLIRYDFAKEFCKGKIVLDAACGVGYGSHHIGKLAKEVIGVDISEKAIAYAKEHYQKGNISFKVMDVQQLEFSGRKFDVVCSFETIEHIGDPRYFLIQVKRVLKEDGVLLVSTPYVKRTTENPKNPYHTTEFCRADFEKLLKGFFHKVEIYGERRIQSSLHYYLQKIDFLNIRSKLPIFLCRNISHITGTKSWDEVGLEDLVISEKLISRATELVAICSNKKGGVKMNILYPIIDGEVTGGNMICFRLIEEAIKRGWKVFVNSPTEGKFTKKLRDKGVTIFNIEINRTFRLDKVLKMARIIWKESIDIIHSHTPLPGTVLCRIAGKISNTPVITHEHGLSPLNKNILIKHYQLFLNLITAKLCDRIIAVSNSTKSGLLKRGISEDKVSVIYNGISIKSNHKNPPTNNIKKIYKNLGLTSSSFLVGLVGRIDDTKGQNILIEAASKIVRKFPKTYFIIVGEDFQGGIYINKLKNLSNKLNICDHIFFPGYRDDVKILMDAFDLFVLPSSAEGLPVVILEAMAAATPVIATSVGGNNEIVLDGETGTIIPPKDPEALARAIIYHLENPEISRRMGKKGYERVKKHFSRKKMVEETFKVYKDVLDSNYG